MNPRRRITRRRLLKSAAVAPLIALGPNVQISNAASRRDLPRNVILFMTDQERAIQHFPPGWAKDNLPGLTRLMENGLTFERAFTNACMCSPARSTWLTGYFPAQHGVRYTLEEDMPARDYPQVELPLSLPNLGTVMSAAGFTVIYKGKWHCSKPPGKYWVRKDVEQYGFGRWDPQDAGANQDISEGGGGDADNDGRFMHDDGQWQAGREGAIPWLRSQASKRQPFFLIISLVNPHDVLMYPRTYKDAGYTDAWLDGDIDVPDTIGEDLSTKPNVQQQWLDICNLGLGALPTLERQQNYLRFYGNLMRSSDRYLLEVLEVLAQLDLLEDTLIIRTADHGEMGLAHGGQRQKNFNFYEESLRVPLVYSNPRLYESPQRTRALVSHVDFLPTIASLYDAPDSARANWQGIDYSGLILDPDAPPVQDYTVFTYDDYQSGQASGLYPTPPNHIVSIREERYKLAEYYDVDGNEPSQWEMYDLLHDPPEINNLAYRIEDQPPDVQEEFARLVLKLDEVKRERLAPLD